MRFNHCLFIVELLASAGVLSAGPVTWHLTNILFTDGTVVTGYFVFDADTTTFSNLNITTSGGTSVPSESSWVFNTNLLPIAEQNASGTTGFDAVDALSGNEVGAHDVSFFSTLGPLMTDAGGTITLNNFSAGTCDVANCGLLSSTHPFSESGQGEFTSQTTPEPSTLILGGSALLFGAGLRRRIFSRG